MGKHAGGHADCSAIRRYLAEYRSVSPAPRVVADRDGTEDLGAGSANNLNVVPRSAKSDVYVDVFEHGQTLGHGLGRRNVYERRLMM